MLERYEPNITIEKVINSSKEVRAGANKEAKNDTEHIRSPKPEKEPDFNDIKTSNRSPREGHLATGEVQVVESKKKDMKYENDTSLAPKPQRTPRHRDRTATAMEYVSSEIGSEEPRESPDRSAEIAPLLVDEGDSDVSQDDNYESDDGECHPLRHSGPSGQHPTSTHDLYSGEPKESTESPSVDISNTSHGPARNDYTQGKHIIGSGATSVSNTHRYPTVFSTQEPKEQDASKKEERGRGRANNLNPSNEYQGLQSPFGLSPGAGKSAVKSLPPLSDILALESNCTLSKKKHSGPSEGEITGNAASMAQPLNSFQEMGSASDMLYWGNELPNITKPAVKPSEPFSGKAMSDDINNSTDTAHSSQETPVATGSEDQDSDVTGIDFLGTCFPDVDRSILETLFSSNNGDVVKTVELILASNEGDIAGVSSTVTEDTEEAPPRNASFPAKESLIRNTSFPANETLPRNASLPGNNQHSAEGLDTNLHLKDMSVAGDSGVPDFPDSFTFANTGGALASGPSYCPPSTHPNQRRSHFGLNSQAAVENDLSSNAMQSDMVDIRAPGMLHTVAPSLNHGQATLTSKTPTIVSTTDVPAASANSVNLTKEPHNPVTEKSCFQLSLEPAVALHLIEMFGPVAGVNFQGL